MNFHDQVTNNSTPIYNPDPDQIDLFRRGVGELDNTPFDKGPTVINAYYRVFLI